MRDLNKAFDVQEMGEGADFKTILLAIIAEGIEALDETNWKWWKEKPHNQDALEDEIADIFIFVSLLAKKAGMDSSKLAERVWAKTQYNINRPDHKNYQPSIDGEGDEK